MLLIITSTNSELLRGVNIDDLNDLESSKLGVLVNFFCDFGL